MRTEHKLHEECGVFGTATTREDAAGITYNGLLSLQHRGQEGAGIAVVAGSRIICHKNTGLVSEVFSGNALAALSGSRIAVGHTRYSTTGGNTIENVGPFVTEFLTGRIATAHNGNITNARQLREILKTYGLHFEASSDSEVISSLIAYCVTREDDTLRGVIRAGRLLRGAFSLVIVTSDQKLIALRDPNGYRPLCIGRGPLGLAVASESCELEACGFTLVRDVQPGELIVIENEQITYEK
ncbi:MAG: class II glutamine amidotransferase, partial [Eubacteriales bacterium]|nr:class II glutamine amidotransferase [Eubacteriales bacterium]